MNARSILFQVHPSSGLPIYRQIMDQVRSLIAAGTLNEGDMLPSTRELAASLEVNMMTVSKAYSRLELEGVARRMRGRGMQVVRTAPTTSVAQRKKEAAALLEPHLLQTIQLGLTDEQILTIIQRLLREQRS